MACYLTWTTEQPPAFQEVICPVLGQLGLLVLEAFLSYRYLKNSNLNSKYNFNSLIPLLNYILSQIIDSGGFILGSNNHQLNGIQTIIYVSS